MDGDAICNARETLDMLVRSLSPGSFFNIIGFGSSFHPLFSEGSVAYDQSSLDRGVQHAKGLEASLGGTNILNPLKHIYSKKPVPKLARQIFLLTDGAVSNTAAVVKAVSDNAHNTRVFTFGIGSGVSTDLVTNVARAGKGKAVFISGKERMQSRVMEVMNVAMSPSYTDIRVTGSKEMTVYPKSIPVLFENEPFVVVAFLSEKMVEGEKMSATLKYSSDRETKVCTVEFSLSDSVSSLSPQLPPELVHQFGVSKALRELEGGASRKEECVTLSCHTNVLCKETAFVAVSEDEGRVVERSMKVYSLETASPYTDFGLFSRRASSPSYCRAYSYSSCSPKDACYSSQCDSSYQSPGMSNSSADSLTSCSSPRYRATENHSSSAFSFPFFSKKKKIQKKSTPIVPLPIRHTERPRNACIARSSSSYDRSHNAISNPLGFELDSDCEPRRATMDLYTEIMESESSMLRRTCVENSLATDMDLYPNFSYYRDIESEIGAYSSKSSPVSHQSIMALQKAEGYWEYSEEIGKLLSCEEVEKSCPSELKDLEIWVTLLCIACLHARFTSYKSEWLLVSKKGERWVESKLESVEGKPSYLHLLKLATDCLKA